MLRSSAMMMAARAMRLVGVASSRPWILPRRPIAGAAAAQINPTGLAQSLDATMPWLVGEIQTRSYARGRAASKYDEEIEDDDFVEDVDDEDDDDDDDDDNDDKGGDNFRVSNNENFNFRNDDYNCRKTMRGYNSDGSYFKKYISSDSD